MESWLFSEAVREEDAVTSDGVTVTPEPDSPLAFGSANTRVPVALTGDVLTLIGTSEGTRVLEGVSVQPNFVISAPAGFSCR